jgi:hypothetical protein
MYGTKLVRVCAGDEFFGDGVIGHIFPCLVKVGVGSASRCPFVAISLIPRTEIYVSLSGSFCSLMPKSKASVFPDFLSKVFTDRFC